jgi:hypothetical protein
MSAGGHFNPLESRHAHPSTAERHTGDMPTLVANASGNAALTTELDLMRVGAGANDIVGKSVVVHKDPDDFTTQPAGNSGPRVACGVIRKAVTIALGRGARGRSRRVCFRRAREERPRPIPAWVRGFDRSAGVRSRASSRSSRTMAA